MLTQDERIVDFCSEDRNFVFTSHAKIRRQQRGIRLDDLKTLLTLGRDGNGRVVLSPADIAAEIAERKREIACLLRLRGKVAVIEGDRLVTVYAETGAGRRENKRRN